MTKDANGKGLATKFDWSASEDPARLTQISFREAYYHLVNVEEHPEVLPLAYDFVSECLSKAEVDPVIEVGSPLKGDISAQVSKVIEFLRARGSRFGRPWRGSTDDLTRRKALHYFVQYMPAAVLDGCWLQGGLRVSLAHTQLGACLTGLYQHQLRAFVADPGRHFVADYRSTCEHLGRPPEEVSSHSFAERADFAETSFALPVFLLGLAQFTRTYAGAVLGLNLAWQFLDLSAFGPDLIRDTRMAYGLPLDEISRDDSDENERGREMARDAVIDFLGSLDAGTLPEEWTQVLRGVVAAVDLWTKWLDGVDATAPAGSPDLQQEMIDLLRRKAPHASGYHGDRRLGSRRIDEHLDPEKFDGPALLDALAKSPWVKPGRSDKSALLNRLIAFGGPMLAVFSPVEQEIIRKWIDSLPTEEGEVSSARPDSSEAVTSPPAIDERYVSGRTWEPGTFHRRSERLYGKCTTRDLYHYLVNVEFHPEILPVAERFAHERLERSMAMLWKGDRPIPSRRYDPERLDRWVHQKHREQVDSYRPPDVRLEASKEAFIEGTVQLAPLILIDGGWLQGIASPALIHTPVGRMLFHVLVEELGEGKMVEHHANVYRDLLTKMGEEPPPVDSWEFAHWSRLTDESFDVPTLWLSISCFPRHFLPEILGLNLAVELAGVGGPYMEARDTLRRFRYPTLFVEVHNAADNVSVGHSAWAVMAIKRYLDEVAGRDGPHNVDRIWQRVWSGVRATLPQISGVRMQAYRIRRRLFGDHPTTIPTIFPS